VLNCFLPIEVHIPITIIFNWICVLQLPSIDFFCSVCFFLLILSSHPPTTNCNFSCTFFLFFLCSHSLLPSSFRSHYFFILISMWNFFLCVQGLFELWEWISEYEYMVGENKWAARRNGKCKKQKKQKIMFLSHQEFAIEQQCW